MILWNDTGCSTGIPGRSTGTLFPETCYP